MTAIPSVFEYIQARLQAFGARFRVVEHAAAGQSDVVAAIRGTRPEQGAKAMLCRSRADVQMYVLAVLPGDRRLDFRRVADAAGLATTEEAERLTGCGVGAIPPFSPSKEVELFVDPLLVATTEEIAFNAGRLDRSIVLDSLDYLRMAQPR